MNGSNNQTTNHGSFGPREPRSADRAPRPHRRPWKVLIAAGLLGLAAGPLALLVKSRAARRPAPASSSAELAPGGRGAEDRRAGGLADGRAAPKLLAIPASKAVQTDPTAPDYDFGKLIEITDGDVVGIHEAEPKDPRWSGPMEDRVRAGLERDLERSGLRARVRELDCRTATCRLTLEADSDYDMKAAASLAQAFRRGYYVSLGATPAGVDHGVTMYFGFERKSRDLQKNDRYYAMARRVKLQVMREAQRSGNHQFLFPLPAE